MSQGELEWFGWDVDQIWEKLGFLWQSNRIRDPLVCNQLGVNPLPTTEKNWEVWLGWKQEWVLGAPHMGLVN